MIKPEILFTSGHYRDPAIARSTERAAAFRVHQWLEHAAAHHPERPVTMMPVDGPHAVTETQYLTIRQSLRSSAFPCPVGVLLNNRCIMWAQDERAIPDTLEQARAILQCFHLTNRSRLPL